MAKKMTASEIVYTALVWGEEGIVGMIAGCDEKDPYRAECEEKLKQLRAYRKRRYGQKPDPFKDCKPINVFELHKKSIADDTP